MIGMINWESELNQPEVAVDCSVIVYLTAISGLQKFVEDNYL